MHLTNVFKKYISLHIQPWMYLEPILDPSNGVVNPDGMWYH